MGKLAGIWKKIKYTLQDLFKRHYKIPQIGDPKPLQLPQITIDRGTSTSQLHNFNIDDYLNY